MYVAVMVKDTLPRRGTSTCALSPKWLAGWSAVHGAEALTSGLKLALGVHDRLEVLREAAVCLGKVQNWRSASDDALQNEVNYRYEVRSTI